MLPLTNNRQAEYVEALKRGWGFAAHGAGVRWWYHYRLPEDWCGPGAKTQCLSLLVDHTGKTMRRLAHEFEPTLHWISQCRVAVEREER